MAKTLALVASAVVAGIGALFAGAAGADEASGDALLFGRGPGDGRAFGCFVRHDLAGHLAFDKKHNVRSMMLFVDSEVAGGRRVYNVSIGVKVRLDERQFQLAGNCAATEAGKAGLAFRIACDSIAVSARDANAVLVEIPAAPAVFDVETGAPAEVRFGLDDRLFRLDRTSLTACLPLVGDEEAKAMIEAIN